MNIIPVILVIILGILFFLVYKRTERFIPDFSTLIKEGRKRENENYKVLTNIDNICQDGLSITHILQGRTHYVLKNGLPEKHIYLKDKIELPNHWTGVDLLAKHTNNRLFVLKDTNLYFTDDFNTTYELSDLYPNIPSKSYKGIIQLIDETLFFHDSNIITYNNENKTYTTESLPSGIPRDYSRVFIFYPEPEPVLIFIRNNHYFRYNIKDKEVLNKVGIKFSGYFPLKSDIIEFTPLGNKGLFGPRSNDILKTKEDLVIRDGVQEMTVTKNQEGTYRMEVLGAGQKNGGFGARIFTEISLKVGDKLKIAVGQSGTRLPCQETHDESIKNNLNRLASASGSGGTSVKLNNNLLVIAGGGGGFSSGLFAVPENCHASITNKPLDSLVSIPIMKVVFKTPPKMFTVSGNNTRFTKRYQTEFIFKEPLIDYVIDFTQQKMEDVTLVDLNGNMIKIDGSITRLTPVIVLVQAIKYTPLSLRNCKEPVKNMFCNEGNSLLENKNVNATGSMEKINGNVIVYGGFNGGGVASMNIKTAIPHCGGGGGATGGNSALNDFSIDNMGNNHRVVSLNDNNLLIDDKITIHTPVTVGSGGSSYIDSSLENSKINNKFNDTYGKVLLIKKEDYYTAEEDIEEESTYLGHQMRSKNYLLSHYKGTLSKIRVINKISLDRNYNFNQLRVKILFNLNDVTTNNLNQASVGRFIKIQPVFFVAGKGQILRYDLPDDNALLDTIVPENILHDTEFNEELEKDTNKLSGILTKHLYSVSIENGGKVDINGDTLEYTNFYEVKDDKLSPSELYVIFDTPLTGINYNLVTIQCNNESMSAHDYLFNKILKKRDKNSKL